MASFGLFDMRGRHFGIRLRGQDPDGRTVDIARNIIGVEVGPGPWIKIEFTNTYDITIRYVGEREDEAETTAEIQLFSDFKPCEDLLTDEDKEEKRRRGEPEDGKLSGVSLERVVNYIERLGILCRY